MGCRYADLARIHNIYKVNSPNVKEFAGDRHSLREGAAHYGKELSLRMTHVCLYCDYFI